MGGVYSLPQAPPSPRLALSRAGGSGQKRGSASVGWGHVRRHPGRGKFRRLGIVSIVAKMSGVLACIAHVARLWARVVLCPPGGGRSPASSPEEGSDARGQTTAPICTSRDEAAWSHRERAVGIVSTQLLAASGRAACCARYKMRAHRAQAAFASVDFCASSHSRVGRSPAPPPPTATKRRLCPSFTPRYALAPFEASGISSVVAEEDTQTRCGTTSARRAE